MLYICECVFGHDVQNIIQNHKNTEMKTFEASKSRISKCKQVDCYFVFVFLMQKVNIYWILVVKAKKKKIWHIESILSKQKLKSKLILLKSKLIRISGHTRCCQLEYIYKCSAGIFIDSLSRLLKFSKLNLKNETKKRPYRIKKKTLQLYCVVKKNRLSLKLNVRLINFHFDFTFFRISSCSNFSYVSEQYLLNYCFLFCHFIFVFVYFFFYLSISLSLSVYFSISILYGTVSKTSKKNSLFCILVKRLLIERKNSFFFFNDFNPIYFI